MRRLLGLGVVLVLAAMTSLALSAPRVLATHVKCGDTITQDTTLDSDLIDCPQDGIVIGAGGLTLDLNRHTIDGDNSGFEDHGVDNGAGRDTVTVRGPGIVQGFMNGVALANASDNVVRRINASRNSFSGVRLEGHTATGNLIVHNVFSENGAGVSVTDDYALNVDAGNNRVRGNIAYGNGYGILLGGYGNGNQIEHNSIWNNGIGIELSDSFGASVVGQNRLSRNGSGINLFESQNTHVRENRVSYSGTGSFVSSGDGIFVDDRNNVIETNITTQNSDDGIDVGSETTLTKNTSNRNGQLGIRATTGVIDGGGNRAFGNGDPLQCLNVRCE
jgi:parallel beta-helix repeat protein